MKNEVVNKFKLEGIEYRQMLVKCGKKACTLCPHGPYWYARIKKGQRWVHIYIGKKWMTLEQKNELDRAKRAGQEVIQDNILF